VLGVCVCMCVCVSVCLSAVTAVQACCCLPPCDCRYNWCIALVSAAKVMHYIQCSLVSGVLLSMTVKHSYLDLVPVVNLGTLGSSLSPGQMPESLPHSLSYRPVLSLLGTFFSTFSLGDLFCAFLRLVSTSWNTVDRKDHRWSTVL